GLVEPATVHTDFGAAHRLRAIALAHPPDDRSVGLSEQRRPRDQKCAAQRPCARGHGSSNNHKSALGAPFHALTTRRVPSGESAGRRKPQLESPSWVIVCP